MPIEILMPALSPTMTEGTLAKWLKKEGDTIKAGNVIAEIETDKATMEVEAVDEGVMGKILVPEGTEGVKVNAVIALLLEEGEDKKALEKYKISSAAQAVSGKKEEAEAPAKQEPVAAQATRAQAAGQPAAATAAYAVPLAAAGAKLAASPLARRVAGLEGVDLSRVPGTGPHGRVIRADVLEFKARGGGGGGFTQGMVRRVSPEVTELKNNTMRKTIAKRLLEAKQTVPHFYLTIECELAALLDARKQLNAVAIKRAGEGREPEYKLSVNDMIVKAVALGLRDVPEANASWTDNAILQYANVDVCVAVALEGGLVTPVVKNADQKTLPQLAGELKGLIAKARAGSLLPEEWQGGGFTISNLGMYGIKEFSAIINPPQSCILAVGAGEERVVVREGQFRAVQMMSVTLSCDHRVVDGAVGARFLAAFKGYIENPLTMLV